MSLEKAIQKLTQVIQAATPERGVPDGSPIGREVTTRRPNCKNITSDSSYYCNCYKEANPGFTGPCYFNCRTITFKPYPSLSQDTNVPTRPECKPNGIEGVA